MSTADLLTFGAGMLVIAILLTIPTMKQRKARSVLDVFADGVPSVAFLVIFVVFMAQIIARYFFKSSFSWSSDVSILGYMYCMYFGSGRAITNDEHVVFSLVYDKLSPKGRLTMRILSNTAMIILLGITVVPSYTIINMMPGVIGALKIPMKTVFLPYLWFLVETMIRCAFYIKDSIADYKNGTLDPHLTETEAKNQMKEEIA